MRASRTEVDELQGLSIEEYKSCHGGSRDVSGSQETLMSSLFNEAPSHLFNTSVLSELCEGLLVVKFNIPWS